MSGSFQGQAIVASLASTETGYAFAVSPSSNSAGMPKPATSARIIFRLRPRLPEGRRILEKRQELQFISLWRAGRGVHQLQIDAEEI